jgi:DNA (cytosine-5)-methyltransferase 1
MVDIMVWGFPCTSYSIAGKRLGLDDPNTGDLFHEGLRVLKEVMPEWTIVENVKGLLSIDDGETIKMILRDLSEAGYAITMDLINTKSYGVPQSRDRVFIIGKRID